MFIRVCDICGKELPKEDPLDQVDGDYELSVWKEYDDCKIEETRIDMCRDCRLIFQQRIEDLIKERRPSIGDAKRGKRTNRKNPSKSL